jgi:hypothetical protein
MTEHSREGGRAAPGPVGGDRLAIVALADDGEDAR